MPLIKISDIDTEGSVQVRARIDPRTVADYAEHITAKRPPLPAIIVFGPDSRGKYYLSEGWHRLDAHKRADRTSINATIQDGDWKAALEHALGSNAQHGLRRTNADKRHAVELALKHWGEWSDQVIADKCAVHVNTVRAIRSEIQPPQIVGVDASRTVIGKDGKKRVVPPVPMRPPPSEPPSGRDITATGKPPPAPVQRSENEPSEDSAPEQPPLPTDRLNCVVPPHLVPLWERRLEVQGLLDQLSRIRAAIQQAQEDRDPLFYGAGQGQTPINFSSALTHLQQARSAINEAMPFAVCPMCQGGGCRCCSGNGLISKYRYETIIPSEKKVNR